MEVPIELCPTKDLEEFSQIKDLELEKIKPSLKILETKSLSRGGLNVLRVNATRNGSWHEWEESYRNNVYRGDYPFKEDGTLPEYFEVEKRVPDLRFGCEDRYLVKFYVGVL